MKFYKQMDDIMYQEDEDGKYILFNGRTSSVHILTSLGFKIWKSCEESISLDEIINQLINEEILEDTGDFAEYKGVLERFIDDLIKRGLIAITSQYDNA